MTLLQKRKTGNGNLFPSLRNDFFPNRLFTPRLFDIENDLWNVNVNTPPANVSETNKEYKIELSVPGLKKEDFNINIDNGFLTISSEKEEENREEDNNYSCREFSYSSFSRSFQLPENVNENNINAKYENGMLQLIVPKKEIGISKAKSIKVS